jgi:hypothetical protein
MLGGKGTSNTAIKRQTCGKQWNAKIKEKVQNVKQRSTKHTHKTKDRATQTPLKPGCFKRPFIAISHLVSKTKPYVPRDHSLLYLTTCQRLRHMFQETIHCYISSRV